MTEHRNEWMPTPMQRAVDRLRAQLAAAEARNRALEGALRWISRYRAHASNCAVGDTEFCTCGLRQAADNARRAITPESAPGRIAAHDRVEWAPMHTDVHEDTPSAGGDDANRI